MTKMAQTRLAVTVSGEQKLLLSFIQEDDGGVQIIMPSKGRKHDNGKIIKNQKYSVHRSLKSDQDITTLKHKIEFDDGTEFDSAQMRFLSSIFLLCPIFGNYILDVPCVSA